MKTMESVAASAIDEHFDVPLDALFNYKQYGEKEMETMVPDWSLFDDIASERYLDAPLGGDMLPVECVGMDALKDSELLGSLSEVITMDTEISSADRIRSPSCKSCTSDTDSQYDSGIGESLSGEDPEGSSVSGSSSTCSQKTAALSPNQIHGTSNEVDVVDVRSEAETEKSIPTKRDTSRYNLRTSSVIKRVETEQKSRSPRQQKPKMRPPPLSKYRRKTANARERGRMTEINEAFMELQNVLPELPDGKQTKITTLKLAMNYISALRELLANGQDQAGPSNSGSLDKAQAGTVQTQKKL